MNTFKSKEKSCKDFRNQSFASSIKKPVIDPATHPANNSASQKEIRGWISEKLTSETEWIARSICPDDLINWRLDDIISYIVNKHHQFSKDHASTILDLTHELLYKNSNKHPEIQELATEIVLFLHDYLNYMRKEEQILFANIEYLIRKKHQSHRGAYSTFGLIRRCVDEIRNDHKATSEKLRYFQKLTDGYSIPADACFEYKYLFQMMKEFEADFLVHTYLENNIVFPRALLEDGEPEKAYFSIVK